MQLKSATIDNTSCDLFLTPPSSSLSEVSGVVARYGAVGDLTRALAAPRSLPRGLADALAQAHPPDPPDPPDPRPDPRPVACLVFIILSFLL